MPGRYYAASLVRWREGNLCPVGGWGRITTSPLASVPRAGFTWEDSGYRRHTAILCDSHVYRMQDSVWTNLTPSDFIAASFTTRGFGSGNFGVADFGEDTENRSGSVNFNNLPVTFSMDNWGDELLFASSADGRVFFWDPSVGGAAAPCPGLPGLCQSFLSTEEHHLMIFGVGGIPNRIAWSDQGNRAGWNFANVTGQAGFFDLENAGQILTARKVPGGILIFTQTSVWLGTYIGSPYFYGFQKIAESVAPLSPQSVVVAAGKAYWMGRRGFHIYDGGVVRPLPCTLDLDPNESMNLASAMRRVCGGYNGLFDEIWWFYPSKGQNKEIPENDYYCVYNFTDNWWSEGKLARSFYTADLIEGYPMAGDPDSLHVLQHEVNYLDNGSPRTDMVWAEVSSISFDDADTNHSVMQGQVDSRPGTEGATEFTFSGVTSRGAPYREFGTWRANALGYLGCRFTARDFALRVTGIEDVPWSVGALNFRTVARGAR